jgi:hypothetical protein
MCPEVLIISSARPINQNSRRHLCQITAEVPFANKTFYTVPPHADKHEIRKESLLKPIDLALGSVIIFSCLPLTSAMAISTPGKGFPWNRVLLSLKDSWLS